MSDTDTDRRKQTDTHAHTYIERKQEGGGATTEGKVSGWEKKRGSNVFKQLSITPR